MPNAWMTHVKKTRALMGGNPSLKQVLKQAKKTYKKSGGGVASNASDFSSAGASAQESMGDKENMGGGMMEGNVNKKSNDSAAHQNAGEGADGQSGGRRRRRRRRSRKSRRKSRKSKRKGKKSRRSRRKGKKSRKKSRRRRRR
tara:strand:+ start:580 stop:1008 length:429 start_codon:yes stop_codon:yes gene_type:complete